MLSVWLAAPAAAQDPLFRAHTDLVRVVVMVEDPDGRPITGLSMGDFEVWEDGRRQAVRLLAPGDGAGQAGAPALHVGVLLDVSESMAEGLAMTRTAAIRLLSRLPEAADITVVDFDEQVRAARFESDDFPHLVERIRRQQVSGWTALYDAIGLYLSAAAEQEGRKVMLLYSDGDDTRSALRYGELLQLLRASDVTIYAVSAVDPKLRGPELRRRAVLEQLAETTGGLAFFPTSVEDLEEVYDRILSGIRSQYTLGYQSTNLRRDGAWREIEVRVVGRPGARLRARAGYFAPFEPEP
jgi:Ca-activated chloride channel family protein